MNIAIFPGTFNPIHVAHLMLAEIARCQFNLDKVIFITSFIPPHRNKEIAGACYRHEMVKLCCLENSFFEASEIELTRKGPSYTYDTVVEAQKVYTKADKIFMVIGADAVRQLHTWHNNQDLVDRTHFLIAARPGDPDIKSCLTETGLKGFQYEVINAPLLEISSTLVRNRIHNGQSIKYLVTDKVCEYIKSNGLYKEQDNGN